jgi:hypothetical protein
MMKRYYKWFFMVFLGFNISSAYAVTVDSDEVIKEILNHIIDGSDMVGMDVTVDGASTTKWDGVLAAAPSGWKLEYTGTDTRGGIWKFTNDSSASVNTVKLDAFGANAVFDWEFDFGSEGTEGSKAGDFIYNGPADTEFTGPVKLVGSLAPVGDLYRWLTFDFTGAGGLSAGESFEFTIDSDEFSPVPLPPAAILLFSGLLGLTGLRYRQKS